MLKEEGISCKEEKNEFPGCAEKQKKEDLKVMQTFTFLCLAIAVICGMLNYLMLETLNWFWFGSSRMHLCMADRLCGVYETEKYSEE